MRRWASTLVAGGLLAWIGTDAGARTAAAPAPGLTTLYIGTQGQSIQSARLDERTGQLTLLGTAAEVERPTGLGTDPKRPVIYSGSETGNSGGAQGGVYALALGPEPGKLTVINRVDSGGGGATHLTYDPRLAALFVANFGGGQVSAIPVGSDGRLSPATSTVSDYGKGPHRRQTTPHAHAVAVDPSGRYLLAADMGADRLFVYRYDRATGKLTPSDPPFEQFPAGSGPRHLVFSADGRFVYVDTELSAELRSFRWNATTGRLTPLQAISTDTPSFAGEKSAAEIALSLDGRFLYVSNRGEDQMVVYAIDRATGMVREVQRLASGGHVPWSFTISPSGRWLVVAHQASDALTVFRVDPATGRLTPAGTPLAITKPVSIAFSRR